MKYAIVCDIKGDAGKYHNELMHSIAHKFGVDYPLKQNFKPHFTLKYGFEIADIHKIETIIEKFCSSHEKTSVQMGGFGCFRNSVLFMKIALSDEARKSFLDFIDMLKKVPEMTWREHEGESLDFHATIASHCEEKLAEIKDFIKDEDAQFAIWFDNVTILREVAIIDGIATWENHKSFELR